MELKFKNSNERNDILQNYYNLSYPLRKISINLTESTKKELTVWCMLYVGQEKQKSF